MDAEQTAEHESHSRMVAMARAAHEAGSRVIIIDLNERHYTRDAEVSYYVEHAIDVLTDMYDESLTQPIFLGVMSEDFLMSTPAATLLHGVIFFRSRPGLSIYVERSECSD